MAGATSLASRAPATGLAFASASASLPPASYLSHNRLAAGLTKSFKNQTTCALHPDPRPRSLSLQFSSAGRKLKQAATAASAAAPASLFPTRRALLLCMAAEGGSLSLQPSASSASASSAPGTLLSVASSDLLVVGPGVLGSLIAQQWLAEGKEDGAKVFGKTRSSSRHDELQEIGVIPITSFEEGFPEGQKFPFVVFCAPPSNNEDYVGEVRKAAALWDGSGSFLFTSSSGVFSVSDNGPCDETAPVLPLGASPRVDRLLLSEQEAISADGNVVRLAGLYTLERGAHTFWMRQAEVDLRGDHILNLISYEDAASLCVAILKSKSRGKTFMGCDNHPVSRKELMDVTVKSGKFTGPFTGFVGTGGPLGKSMDNSITREKLGWAPKYSSFEEFLRLQ